MLDRTVRLIEKNSTWWEFTMLLQVYYVMLQVLDYEMNITNSSGPA